MVNHRAFYIWELLSMKKILEHQLTLNHSIVTFIQDLNWSSKATKRICSNDKMFLEKSKKYLAYLPASSHSSNETIRSFGKIDKQPRSAFKQKRIS